MACWLCVFSAFIAWGRRVTSAQWTRWWHRISGAFLKLSFKAYFVSLANSSTRLQGNSHRVFPKNENSEIIFNKLNDFYESFKAATTWLRGAYKKWKHEIKDEGSRKLFETRQNEKNVTQQTQKLFLFQLFLLSILFRRRLKSWMRNCFREAFLTGHHL